MRSTQTSSSDRVTRPRRGAGGFTLVEMLVVIAIISIMSGLVITAIANAATDTRTILARQQQAVLQEALNAWVNSASKGNLGLSKAKADYDGAGSAQAKLTLIRDYLDPGTYSNFSTNSGGGLQTDAMSKIGKSITFSTWTSNSYPRVEM